MIKRTQLILLPMLVLSVVVMLGSIPAVAQDTTNITGIRVDGGMIVTSVSGQTPIDPCYNPTPEDLSSSCEPMYVATVLKICSENPEIFSDTYNFSTCRQFVSSTFGAAHNTWLIIGGRWRYIAP